MPDFDERPTDSEGYSSKQVATITGCTYRQLDHWVNSKYLTPKVESTGSGSVRVFDAMTIDIVRIALDLIDAGFTPVSALGYAEQLSLDPGNPIICGGNIVTLWIPEPESTSNETATESA